MYNGKYNSGKKRHKRSVVLAVSVLVLLTIAITGTIAYLLDETGPIKNIFQPTSVPNKVEETFENGKKTDVMINNMSTDVPAYIRAKVVVNWVNPNNTSEVAGTMPVKETDYKIDMQLKGWEEYEGYYYYTSIVQPGDNTDILFTDCYPIGNNAPSGYVLSVEILGESIQAVGQDAKGNKPIALSWGVDIVDGEVVSATITE